MMGSVGYPLQLYHYSIGDPEDNSRVNASCFQNNVESRDGKVYIFTQCITCFEDEEFGGERHDRRIDEGQPVRPIDNSPILRDPGP